MNRRELAAGIAAASSSIAMLRVPVRALTPVAEAVPTFDSLTLEEAMYCGMLQTWYDLLFDSVGRIGEAFDDPQITSDRWKRSVYVEIGIWSGLYEDIRQFDAPDVLADSRDALEEAFESLDRASFLMANGLENYDDQALIEAADYIGEATDSIETYQAILPFRIPRRTSVDQ